MRGRPLPSSYYSVRLYDLRTRSDAMRARGERNTLDAPAPRPPGETLVAPFLWMCGSKATIFGPWVWGASPARELLNCSKVISCRRPPIAWLTARNRGVILEDESGSGSSVRSTHTELKRMPQPFGSTSSPENGDSGTSDVADNREAAEPSNRASQQERSRFSQWLASFGLGEMPLPLLTRRRAQRG